MNKKKKGWFNKSRRHRKKVWIEIKNNISNSRHTGSELFYSYDYIHDNTQWVDIFFLGKNKVVYNATIMTAKYDYYEKVRTLVWDKLDQLLEENDSRIIYSTDKIFKPKNRSHTYTKDEKIPCLGDMTEGEFFESEKERIAKEKVVQTFEFTTKDFSYKCGIGLEMVVDADALTVDRIDSIIRNFRAHDEIEIIMPYLIHFDYEVIKDLGMYSANQLILADL